VAATAVAHRPVVREVEFYKMSGSGNDFIVLDGRSTAAAHWSPDRIRSICDRHRGVGADGLVVLTPASADAVRMAYWNSDGSHGALCGNAALCCAGLAVRLKLVPEGEFSLLTDAGPIRVNCPAEGSDVEISLPEIEAPRDLSSLGLGQGECWMTFVVVGVPHLVVRVADIEAIDVGRRGRQLRFETALGRAGANVNFVSPSSGTDQPWRIRTYERGVEAETLACGTGTAAAAVALAARHEARLPIRLRSRGGSELTVRGELADPGTSSLWLAGEGRLVFRGIWESQ
jgi:diaminopimelate epimerase